MPVPRKLEQEAERLREEEERALYLREEDRRLQEERRAKRAQQKAERARREGKTEVDSESAQLAASEKLLSKHIEDALGQAVAPLNVSKTVRSAQGTKELTPARVLHTG